MFVNNKQASSQHGDSMESDSFRDAESMEIISEPLSRDNKHILHGILQKINRGAAFFQKTGEANPKEDSCKSFFKIILCP